MAPAFNRDPSAAVIDELMSELFEAHTPRDSLFVQQTIEGGDRRAVLAALLEVNQSAAAFKDEVAALGAEPAQTQGLVARLVRDADEARAALEQRLLAVVAAETGMAVFAARDGLRYRGPVVQADTWFQYQQVAPNTLIARDADEALEAAGQGRGHVVDRATDRDSAIEYG